MLKRSRALALAVCVGVAALVSEHRSVGDREASEQRPLWIFYDSTRTNAASVVAEIARRGGNVRVISRWLHAVSADINPDRLRRFPHALNIEPVGRMYAMASRTTRPRSHALLQQDTTQYGPNYPALRELGIPQAHGLGFTGNNILIAILDTGFEPSHEALVNARVFAQRDFINNDGNVRDEPGDPLLERDQEIHGTWVWSLLGGNRPGRIIGPAYNARFILAKVDDDQVGAEELGADEDRWVQAVEWADSLGARLINSSLAFRDFSDRQDYTSAMLNGDSARSTRIADQAARRGILIVTAAGNGGPAPQSIFAPGDADSVLTVGAIDANNNVMPNSSRGLTVDGRIKPDVVARGANLQVAASPQVNTYAIVSEGTSLATPLVAGGAAQFMEAWPAFNNMAVIRALRESASNANLPNGDRGFGVPNIAAAIVFPNGITLNDPSDYNPATRTLTSIAPTFSWSVPLVHPRVTSPNYRVEIGTDPQLLNVIYRDSVRGATSLRVSTPLRPAGALWFRVTGEAEPGIRRPTEIRGSIIMPDWVRLTTLNEAGAVFVNTTRPVFTWEPLLAPPPLGPFVYELQVLGPAGQIVQIMRNITTASRAPDLDLTPNLSYSWRVIARTQTGMADTVTSRGTFVVNSSTQPPATLLYPPFPNPFPRDELGVTATQFWFDLSEPATVELSIHDLRGRLIKQLIPGPSCGQQEFASGQYGRGALSNVTTDACRMTVWDGTDQRGATVAPGIYIARLRAGSRIATQRVLFTPIR